MTAVEPHPNPRFIHVNELPVLLTRKQTAKALSTGLSTVLNLIAAGKLDEVTLPGTVRVRRVVRASVERLIVDLLTASEEAS